MKLNDVEDFEIVYRLHASKRMFEREISNDDVKYLLKNGEIIERYDEDYPLPSLLLNGFSTNKRSLHLVVAVNRNEKRLIIVTVYEPNPLKWSDDFSRRK